MPRSRGKPEISSEEVRKHCTRRSAWIIINNEVLDVTKFLNEHPGGEDTILEFAGLDATQAFNDVGHSKDAREMKKKYKIGVLPANEADAQTCCVGIPKRPSRYNEKTWRSFDGSPSSRSPAHRSRDRLTPSPSAHVGTIIVPRENFASRRVWEAPPPPEPSKFPLKWVLLALGLVVVLGFAYKKFSE